MTRTELYQWITILILLIGMTYFLCTSLTKTEKKLKNPNELMSYLALAVINNGIFMAKLCYYAYHIKTEWMDGTQPAEPTNINTLTTVLFIMTFVVLVCVTVILILIIYMAKPLRDIIFEEIFRVIGANVNSV